MHALGSVLAHQPLPPGLRRDKAFALLLGTLQLLQGGREALGDRRKLAPHQRLQLARVAVALLGRDGAQHVQRLQQVLDVVRHARAGFVHRLQVALLAQLLLAQLGDVELAQQLAEQVQVPVQRRAHAKVRVHGKGERAVLELDAARGGLALLSLRLPCAPAHPRYRRQAAQRRERLVQEAVRARLELRQLREEMEPLLDRQPDGKKVAREEHVRPLNPPRGFHASATSSTAPAVMNTV